MTFFYHFSLKKLNMISFNIGCSEIQNVKEKLIKMGKLQLLIEEISNADNFTSIHRLLFSSGTKLLSD